jgi:hypothetical protein
MLGGNQTVSNYALPIPWAIRIPNVSIAYLFQSAEYTYFDRIARFDIS